MPESRVEQESGRDMTGNRLIQRQNIVENTKDNTLPELVDSLSRFLLQLQNSKRSKIGIKTVVN